MLSTPIKGFDLHDITQGFSKKHPALDIVNIGGTSYGTPLCAPEHCVVLRIVGDSYTPDSHANMERGFGIYLKGLETGFTHFFWHTMPTLPVWGGDHVRRGQIVAYMGNAGFVFQGGVYVPISERNKAPYKGTHLHYEMFDKDYVIGQKKTPLNPLDHIDLTLQPNYTEWDKIKAFSVVLTKTARLI